MTTVITGGAGFIGSALCRRLAADKSRNIIVIDKITYASSEATLSSLFSNVNFKLLKADICDFETISSILRESKPREIIHLAAESHVDRSISGSDEFIQTNIIGTHNILKAAREIWEGLKGNAKDNFRMLHVSTDEVFGALGPIGQFSEQSPYDPSSPYSASKAASDHLVSAWHRTYGLPTLTVNCSNNFGPYQNPEKLIPLMIINCLEGLPLPVYGNGMQRRDWIHVNDHVEAMLTVMKKGSAGETYCVGSNNERANIDVVKLICDLVDEHLPTPTRRRDLITYVSDRPGHDFRYAINSKKLEDLGWRAQEKFESGLRKTVSWYLDNKPWWKNFRRP